MNMKYCNVCGEEIPEGAEHQDDEGHYYCADCCDLSDEPEPEWPSDGWCMCKDSSGPGPCPKCGKEMLPF